MAGPRRARLDAELVRRSLAPTRTEAQRLIAAGLVTVDGAPAAKAATQVARGAAVVVHGGPPTWASRAGHKLDGALDVLGVDVAGRTCLDAGASTGGFTDVLLARGAVAVTCVDVGYGQLRWRLRSDSRVTVVDRTNVRHLEAGDLPPPPPDLVVADLSFISLALVVPALARVADPAADHVVMVKPQFEVGQDAVGRGGVVRGPDAWASALARVAAAAEEHRLVPVDACMSPLPGPAGNIEFFWHLRGTAHVDATPRRTVDEAIAAAVDQARLGE